MGSKFSAALIAIAITLVGALAQLTGNVTPSDAVQLVLLAVNALVVYLVPLAGTAAQSTYKTIAAVIVAILTAVAPFVVSGHISGAQIAVVVLAGLQVLGAHVGVQMRVHRNAG